MRTALFLALVCFLVASFVTSGEERILTIRTDPEVLGIAPGGRAAFRLLLENGSLYEVEKIEIAFRNVEGLLVRPSEAARKRLHPFTTAAIGFSLTALPTLETRGSPLLVKAIYSYCIGTECFQEELSIAVSVEEGLVGTLPRAVKGSAPWHLVFPTAGGVLFLAILILGRLRGFSFWTYGALILLIASALAYGVLLRQPRQAQGIASVLCTSCVGIEETRQEEPRLSAQGAAALSRLGRDVELLVFYAPWCQSCPYVEALVEEMAKATEHLVYRFVNVDEERGLALAHGVVSSGRTVVPAVLRVDTGLVIFGVEDLEARLLGLLGLVP